MSLQDLTPSLQREEAMTRAVIDGGYTLRAVAEHFGVHYSTVSRAVRRTGAGALAPQDENGPRG